MDPLLINAVLVRGNNVCAWCACKLNRGRIADTGTVCKLDNSENHSSMVASCVACAAEYAGAWVFTHPYTMENARRILGRHTMLVSSGPFVDYLERATNDWSAFSTALARIEAQRNLPLDLRRVA